MSVLAIDGAGARGWIQRELQEFLFQFMPSLLADMDKCESEGFSRPVASRIVSYFAMIRSIAKISLDGPDCEQQLNLIQSMGTSFEWWSEVLGRGAAAGRRRRRHRRALNDYTHAAYRTYSFVSSPLDENRTELIRRIRESMSLLFAELARSKLTYLQALCEGRLTPFMAYERADRHGAELRNEEGRYDTRGARLAQGKTKLHVAFEITSSLRTTDLKKLAILLGIPTHRRPNNATSEADAVDIVAWAEIEQRLDDLIEEVEGIISKLD